MSREQEVRLISFLAFLSTQLQFYSTNFNSDLFMLAIPGFLNPFPYLTVNAKYSLSHKCVRGTNIPKLIYDSVYVETLKTRRLRYQSGQLS